VSDTPGGFGDDYTIVLAVVADHVGLLCERSETCTAIIIEAGMTWARLTRGAEDCLTDAERDLLRSALGLPLLPAPLPEPHAVAHIPELHAPRVVIMHIDLADPWKLSRLGGG